MTTPVEESTRRRSLAPVEILIPSVYTLGLPLATFRSEGRGGSQEEDSTNE